MKGRDKTKANPPPDPDKGDAVGTKPLSPAAKRALEEAEARRRARRTPEDGAIPEEGGPKGPEPTRYGDWEKDGIVSDF